MHPRLDTLSDHYNLLKDNFLGEDSIQNSLESLLVSQISVLKVFNSIPVVKYNSEQGQDTLHPVALAILMLKVLIVVNDNAEGPNRPNLRKKFVQNDGLKYLFGVSIVDNKCMNPSEFALKSCISDFMF